MLRAQTGEAEKVYHQLWPYVKEERPEASLILQAMTYGLMDEHLFGPAEKCLSKWLEYDPDNIEALLAQGLLLDRNGQGSVESREHYIRALELDPDRADIRLRLALAYLAQQRDREAIEAFKQVLRQQPDNAMAELGLAQATLNLGKGT